MMKPVDAWLPVTPADPQHLLRQLLLTHATWLAVQWSCCFPVRCPFSAPAGIARSAQARRRACWVSGGNEADLGPLSAFAPPLLPKGLDSEASFSWHTIGGRFGPPRALKIQLQGVFLEMREQQGEEWLCSWRFGASSPETRSWEHSLSFY